VRAGGAAGAGEGGLQQHEHEAEEAQAGVEAEDGLEGGRRRGVWPGRPSRRMARGERAGAL
jgi:hypothetical protein